MGMPASANKLHAVEAYCGQASAKAQMPERKVPVPVDVHTASAYRAGTVSVRQIEPAIKAEHFAAGGCPVYACVGVVKPFQPGRNAQESIPVF